MFGIGFPELILIAIIAILFLGPDKLPQAMVDVVKFIRGVKKTVYEAKSSIEQEMHIEELKNEALKYKEELTETTNELKSFKNLSIDEFNEVDREIRNSTKIDYQEAPTALPPKKVEIEEEQKEEKKEEQKVQEKELELVKFDKKGDA